MEKLLKTKYEEPKLEIAMLLNSDVITTSGVGDDIVETGSGTNVDNGGWTNNSTGW